MVERKEQLQDSSSTLLFMRGLPGSGKTLLAYGIRDRFPDKSVKIVDPDEIGHESQEYINFIDKLKSVNPDLEERFFPYRYLMAMAESSLADGGMVIWNQAFTNVNALNRTASKLKNLIDNDIQIAILQIEVSPSVAWERVKDRMQKGGHGMNFETFSIFVQTFGTEEFEYPTINIQSEGLFEDILSEACNKLQETLWADKL